MSDGAALTPLPVEFFARSTLLVAEQLIGMLLVHEIPGQPRLAARIVETEAYREDDPACHGWSNWKRRHQQAPTGRSAPLFGPPGIAYVYLNYGMYWLLNVVTEAEGTGAAVLFRAVEPVEGIDVMRQNRPGVRRERDLTNGPGKLTRALGIDARFHERPLTAPPLYFARPVSPSPSIQAEAETKVATSTRIGITKGTELAWRFFEESNPYVSPADPTKSQQGRSGKLRSRRAR